VSRFLDITTTIGWYLIHQFNITTIIAPVEQCQLILNIFTLLEFHGQVSLNSSIHGIKGRAGNIIKLNTKIMKCIRMT